TAQDGKIEQIDRVIDTGAPADLELGLLKRTRALVLDHLDPGAVANWVVADLDLADAAYVEADAGVEFQRVAPRRGFGVAEDHADLLPELVDEDDRGVGLVGHRGELAQGLAHETRLKAHVRVAHV